MQINVRLLKCLAAIGAASLAVLSGSLLLAMVMKSNVAPIPLIVISSIAAFSSLLWLWVYWLIRFHRTGQRREFWLCYCLPYIYSSYQTVAFLRRPSQDAT